MKTAALRDTYDAGYRNGKRAGKPGAPRGGKSNEPGVMYWVKGRPQATPEAIRDDGVRCLAVAMSGPGQEMPVDRVMALPDLETLLAEFARGFADGQDSYAETEERVAADPQWRGLEPEDG